MARVKICGINDAAAIDAAVAGGADWIGFNFFPPSPRYLTPARARELAARHKDAPLRVGLFVNPTEAMIAEVLDEVPLDILQLYGAGDALAGIPDAVSVAVRSRRSVGVAAAGGPAGPGLERGRRAAGGSKAAARCDPSRRQRGPLRLDPDSRAGVRLDHGCWPVASTRTTLQMPSGFPEPRRSMFRPASSAQKGSRIRVVSRRSSATHAADRLVSIVEL